MVNDFIRYTQIFLYYHLFYTNNNYNKYRVSNTRVAILARNLKNCIIENASAKTNDDLVHPKPNK